MSDNQIAVVTFSEMEKLAHSVAASGLFGLKTKEQAMALMAIAQAEGMHPASAAMQYNIIQGKATLTAEAIMARFLKTGGKVEWHEYNDEKVSATFSHPVGGTVKIDWDMQRAKKAGLAGKDNWIKWPRNMLKARVISEGARMVNPGSTNNFYTPDEVEDFNTLPPKKQKPDLPELIQQQPQQQKIETMYDENEVIDSPSPSPENEQKFGESREDKKLIFEKATQISSAFSIDSSKNEELIKNICRAVLIKDITEKNIDMLISQEFYDVKKNRPEEIVK